MPCDPPSPAPAPPKVGVDIRARIAYAHAYLYNGLCWLLYGRFVTPAPDEPTCTLDCEAVYGPDAPDCTCTGPEVRRITPAREVAALNAHAERLPAPFTGTPYYPDHYPDPED